MAEAPNPNETAKKLPLRKAFMIIALSTFMVSGSCYAVLHYVKHLREKQRNDLAYNIVAIVQTSPHAQGLKTSYLAEVLGLSTDRPGNLFQFSSMEGKKKLLDSPVIKSATVRKIRPGTLHIDYELRKPIAYCGDYVNMAIDADGVVFPINPFFTPKLLPEIRLGDGFSCRSSKGNEVVWGGVVEGAAKELAFSLLEEVPKALEQGTVLVGIDVSRAFAPSDGQREIILRLEDRVTRAGGGQTVQCHYPRIIRLRPETYRQQLDNYRRLSMHLREKERNGARSHLGTVCRSKEMIVDMRLSELAFFSEEP